MLLCLFCLTTHAASFSQSAAFQASLNKRAASGNDPVFASLTHVWHMEEASGNARADSVGSIALNETGGTVNRATGIHGFAADFQPVSQAGHYLVSASNVGTTLDYASFWIKVRSLPTVGTVFSLIGSDSGGYLYCALDENGLITFNDSGIGNDDQSINAPLGTLNAWHLIVIGTDQTTQKMSVDGATFVTDTGISGNFLVPSILNIGQVDLSYNAPLVPDALIDEVMIFSTALTQGNVTTLWNSGAGLFPTP